MSIQPLESSSLLTFYSYEYQSHCGFSHCYRLLREQQFRASTIRESRWSSYVGSSLPDAFVSVLAQIKAKTTMPVLLPTELPRPFRDAKHATVQKVTPDEYAVTLYYELDMGDAGFAALFAGNSKSPYSVQELDNVDRVKLTRGIVGFFSPVSCGGLCAPANL